MFILMCLFLLLSSVDLIVTEKNGPMKLHDNV
jgi:hypothetical protein